ncbi:MAG: hypothetical protein RLZZ386_1568, partial [Planctomycetota bacterium]
MHSKNIPKFHLEGQVVLVTGSSRGLGKAIAFALGDAGAKVALNYWNDSATANGTFAQFKAAGYAGELFRGNVIDENDVNRMCGE